ncbi:MAG: hypothetical protein LH615_15175, partial [Ferruginibacter sp.]|nr:hypothetical protein [Ferruginibacter sp.]
SYSLKPRKGYSIMPYYKYPALTGVACIKASLFLPWSVKHANHFKPAAMALALTNHVFKTFKYLWLIF